jgi:hypothetical protein
VADLRARDFRPPTLLIIGAVAALAEGLPCATPRQEEAARHPAVALHA